MLYLVATPIGNLGDMTYRAVEILKRCDYILCEDTRHSLLLLKHYEIQKPLKSFHKFNEAAQEAKIVQDLKSGQTIAVISDAGTPGISDPGTRLVKSVLKENISVQSIPGPCAAIAALTCSGMNTEQFQFAGFLPRKQNELKKKIQELLHYPGTSICYESPERILKVLQLLTEIASERTIVIARELTKKFEEVKRGTPNELIHYYKEHPLKGEIVCLIEGKKEDSQWENWTPEEHVLFLVQEYNLSRQDAIKMAAQQRKVPKREIYNRLLK